MYARYPERCAPVLYRFCDNPSRPAGSELQRLDLQELLDGQVAVLAAVARLLVAAERSRGVELATVDLNLADAHPPGDALGPLLVTRPHAAGQPIHGFIGDPYGIVLVVVGDED